MTVAHPSVAALAPPPRDRTRISHGKAAVSAGRESRLGGFASSIAISARPLQPITPVVPAVPLSAEARARHVARARIGLVVTSSALRLLVAVALVVALYLVISQGMIAVAGESFATWYTATVAPHLAVDLTPVIAGDVSPFGASTGVPEMLRPVG